jgi:predicted transcriptional regulator
MRVEAVPPILPKDRPPFRKASRKRFDWSRVIDSHVHEVKVAVIEALNWIGGPLSAKELWLIFGPQRYPYPTVAFHVKALAKAGLVQQTDARQARGSSEKYYVLGAVAAA